jgi:glycosyltransferase involved in cell wall biosynthesis
MEHRFDISGRRSVKAKIDMKILYCEYLRTGNISAHSVHIYQVVKNLADLGHDIVMLQAGLPGNGLAIGAGRRSSAEPAKGRLLMAPALRPFRGALVILWSLMIDIRSLWLGFKAIVKQRKRFDVIYRRSHLFNSDFLLARLFGIPVVKEVNGIGVGDLESNGWAGKFSLRIIDRIDRISKPWADKIVVVTPKLKQVLCQDYGVPGEKIVVIPNGTDTELFKPMDTRTAREKLKLDQSCRYVGFVGSFQAWAGIDNFIRSMPLVLQECPGTRFLLVGDGVMRQSIIDLAKENGVYDRIVFTGIVPHQDVPLYINASDVCVCPGADNSRNSRIGGGSPLKLPEYMACARPVVIGSVVELSQEVTRTGSGLAVDMRNKDELAKTLVTLLKDEDLRIKMGMNGRKAALEKYSWRGVAEQIVAVCQSAIERRRN